MDATQVLRELIAKWRDRANESEYKLHREWAIDQCADELEALLPTLESALGERQTMGTDDFQTPVDKRAQQLIDSNPGCTMSAAYRAVALELSNTIPPAVPVDQSAAAKAAHCICSEAYGVGPEKCGAKVHHPRPAAPNERLRGLIEVWRDPANKDLSAFIIEIEVLLPQLEAAIRESQPPPSYETRELVRAEMMRQLSDDLSMEQIANVAYAIESQLAAHIQKEVALAVKTYQDASIAELTAHKIELERKETP